jgi:probable F420-dependent oxidoreductase
MAFSNERARFGITMFPTDYSIQPVELARAAEERGFESLFFPEHTHIPTSRKTPFPGGGALPKHYSHTHDPFVAFGACAAVTKKIRLGTGICLVVQRDPIVLAKEIATVDSLSNGRFVLGIGAGWNREEMQNHGADYTNRWGLVREKILAMKAIWTQDEAQFHGKFVDFDPIWSYPKPAQRGGPPVWIGANSKWVFDRIAEYGDGWMPIGGLGSGNMDRLQAACEARGRKVGDITLALFAAPTKIESLLGRIEQGFDELIFNVESEPADVVLPKLDQLVKLVETVRKG